MTISAMAPKIMAAFAGTVTFRSKKWTITCTFLIDSSIAFMLEPIRIFMIELNEKEEPTPKLAAVAADASAIATPGSIIVGKGF